MTISMFCAVTGPQLFLRKIRDTLSCPATDPAQLQLRSRIRLKGWAKAVKTRKAEQKNPLQLL